MTPRRPAPARPAARRGAREARPLPGGRAALRARAATALDGAARRACRRPRAASARQARPARGPPARPPGRRARRARGADARPRAAPLLPALGRRRGRARRGRARRRGRPRRPHRAADVHDRPRRRPGLRRRHLRARARTAAIRVWVHIADVTRVRAPGRPRSTREAYRRGTSVYVPGHGRADAAGGALEPRLLAAARRGEARRDRRDGDGRRGGPRVVFHRSRVRSRRAAHLRRGRRDLRRPRRAEEPWAAPLAAAREVSRGAARAGATRSSSARPSPSSSSTRGPRHRGPPRGSRPSRTR